VYKIFYLFIRSAIFIL